MGGLVSFCSSTKRYKRSQSLHGRAKVFASNFSTKNRHVQTLGTGSIWSLIKDLPIQRFYCDFDAPHPNPPQDLVEAFETEEYQRKFEAGLQIL